MNHPGSVAGFTKPEAVHLRRMDLSVARSPRRSCQYRRTMPSPGGQASGMAGHKKCCGWAWAGRVWHSASLPQGLPHDSPGAEPHDARTGSVEGRPWAAVWSGCARPTGCHTRPNVQDLRSRCPVRSLGVKHLIKNQVLGGRSYSRSEPANEEHRGLHQLVHQRLRTTMDILEPEPEDEARPWTNCRSSRGAACDYGSED
jgi:hypothetical protein